MEPVKNLTVALPISLARWVRVFAAQKDVSVSKFLAELVENNRKEVDLYQNAYKKYKKIVTSDVSSNKKYPKKDELYG